MIEIQRYTLEKMDNVWSRDNTFLHWFKLEIGILRSQKKLGLIDTEVQDSLVDNVTISPDEIDRIEKEETGHNVVAFLKHVSPQLPAELRSLLHKKVTSCDITDTTLHLQLVESVMLFQRSISILMREIKEKAIIYKYTAQIGRTHGVHAEPITFGVKLSLWHEEFDRHLKRLINLLQQVAVGKASGAVGMYTLPPEVEDELCQSLNLKPILSSQVIPRDILAEYMCVLGLIASSIGKFAGEVRNLQRTEILEAQEYFSPTQRGSSAMPHKKNPKTAEQVCGLADVIIGFVETILQNNKKLWHERTLDNSSTERMIVPAASILLDYCLQTLCEIISKWIIYPEKMRKNLELTKGLIYSQDVLSLLAEKSEVPREEATELVKKIAMDCWNNNKSFLATLLKNSEIMKYITTKELRACFNLNKKLQHVDYIFERIFGQE